MLWINKIYLILLISNYQEFEPKIDEEDRIRILKFVFNAIIVDSKNKKITKKKKKKKWMKKLIRRLIHKINIIRDKKRCDPLLHILCLLLQRNS